MPHRIIPKSSSCRLTLTILCTLIGGILICYVIAFGHVINGGSLLKALQEHYNEQPPTSYSLRRQISSVATDAPSVAALASFSSGSSSSSSEEEEEVKNKDPSSPSTVVATGTTSSSTPIESKDKVVEMKKGSLDIKIDLSSFPKDFASRNLILGIASNIDVKNFAIFCQSLRWNHIDSTVIIFYERPTDTTSNYKQIKQLSQENDITLIEYSMTNDILAPTFLHNYHVSSLRWILYYWLLTDKSRLNTQLFDKILTIDVRDTVFQSDPFLLIPQTAINNTHGEIITMGENTQSSIGTCKWNSGWIKDCFGERIFRLIKSFPILCSDVTLGGSISMINYIIKMGKILLNDYPCINTNFPVCERNGVDQGVHNVLIYMGQIEPSLIKYSNDFPIINLQSSGIIGSLKDLTTGNNGIVSLPPPPLSSNNGDSSIGSAVTRLKSPIKPKESRRENKQWMMSNGSPYAIVHQYDRNYDLQLSLAKRYISWIDFDNPVNEWKTTPTCNNYGVVFGVDLLRGKCDLTSQRVLTAASCCEICSQNNGKDGTTLPCTSFTYSSGTCYMKTCAYETEIAPIVKLVQDPNFRDMTMTQQDTTSAYLLS